MLLRFSHLFIVWALCASAAWAQGVADTTVVLPGVTITATRGEAATTEAPARITVLDAHALEAVVPRSVAALLDARAGAFIRHYGPGGLATLTLRGTGASQTLILLDGLRIADPQLGQLDLSLLPTVLLESVEVMHGAGSALYGTDALGGVVNLRPLRAGAEPMVRVMGGYGAYGEREGGAVLSGRKGRLSGLAAVEYQTVDGDFPFLNPSLFPPREVRREGAGHERLALYATLGYESERHRATVAGWYNDAERGLPGPSTTTPKGERQWDEHLRLWAADQMRFGWGTLRIGGLVQEGALRYANPRLQLDETGRTLTASLEAEARMARGTHWLLAGGLVGGYGRARHPNLPDDATENHFGSFAHATAEYGRLRLFPALRLDTYGIEAGARRTALSPRLGLNLQPFRWEALRLKASLGRSFRTPTFNDRFWQPGGNPNLEPERGWTLDAGVLLDHRTWRTHLQAESSVFTHRLRALFVWQPTTGSIWSPSNFSRVRTVGLEASAEGRFRLARTTTLEGGLFFTRTDARDRSDAALGSFDAQLRYVPRHQFKTYLGGGWRMLRLDLAARYTGRRYITTDGSQFLDPYWTFDAQLRLNGSVPQARMTLALVVENAFDRAFEGIKGYPMPPRTLRLRLLVQWPGEGR